MSSKSDDVETRPGNEHEPLHQELKIEENRTERRKLPSRIRKWVLELVAGTQCGGDEADDDDSESRQVRKRRLVVLSLLAMAVAAYLKSSRRQRNRCTSRTSGALWPISLLIALWKGPEYRRNPRESTMNLLWSAAKDGVIQQAMVGSSAIFFQTTQKTAGNIGSSKAFQWNRTLLPPNNESIKSGLLEALAAGGCETVEAIPESIGSKLATPILAALPFVYLALLYRMMKSQFGGEDISSKLTNGTRKLWGENEESDRTTFADVAGLPSAVEDMSEVVSYLFNPSLYTAMGARPPRGVLLHGPPGSGKTLLARAVAGEAMCDSFTALSGSAFVEMYVGRGAARVRSVFENARKEALRRRKLSQSASWWSSFLGFPTLMAASTLQQRPACAILFIDELDAVAKSRSYDGIHGNDEREQTLNQLLTEMDGFDTGSSKENDSDKDDVTLIVIAASNRVDVIDPAVLRRFDRQIFVGYPDSGGRSDILKVHSRKIACSPNVDWGQLASDAFTDNFSGADLRNVVNEAALFAVREKSSLVEQSHLLHAARRISQMKTRTTVNAGRPALPTFFTNIE